MTMFVERIQTDGIAELSYIVGDTASGTAAVIDPRADVDVYISLSRSLKVAITHIFETHIHADLVSGARELQARTGNADIFVSVEGGAEYEFAHQPVRDGDQFEFGEVILTARHTPGHTPEHMAYEIAEKKRSPKRYGIFTGDSLFVNSAGRPDLLGTGEAEKLADELYDTLYEYYAKLDDSLIIYPAHGAGSPCGASIGDRLESTIGYERQFNPFLQHPYREEFKQYALSTAPPEPTYYKRMKKLNARGPEVRGNLPVVPSLPPEEFKVADNDEKNLVIDTRQMLAFGGGHIKGALNIGDRPELSIWAGWLLDPEQPLLLVTDSDEKVEHVVRLFLRTGFTKFAGYLVGGMKAWDNAAMPLEEIDQMVVHELKERIDEVQVVDVRTPDEWKGGRIPGAKHLFLPELEKKSRELKKSAPVAVYCDSGYRASIGASILQKQGFNVFNIPGSWQAWVNASYPVEK